jgi:NhaP-type Na+/H+ or K+/H+ antiporter
MQRLFAILLTLVISLHSPLLANPDNHGENTPDLASAVEHVEHAHHGPDTSMLFFIIVAVFIGVSTRHLLKKLPIPFTALLLIIGIVLGSFSRLGYFETWGSWDVSFIKDSLYNAAHIDPHLLLYIFLPILIFEAAFAMDFHTFKKTAVNSVLLAVPGILIALVLTALIIIGIDYFDIGLEGWANWSLALMFGAVISATDPVAVVALLKDLGASKKLGTTIEGESLLNDGTAIVIFMVFFGVLTGDADGMNGILKFVIVSFGGIGIGLLMGWICVKWLSKIYTDAMVEITLVVGAAYLTFYVAEHFLHVSGVLALVALGLVLGGPGRSSISPKVEHFMHEFWELAGFIANCIIFLIVGLVISQRTQFTGSDFVILLIVYIGIHVVRAIVLTIFFPIMKNAGYGLTKKEGVVVWYGALRGAIGLALALIVANIDPNDLVQTMNVSLEQAIEIKEEFLFLIAGTVTLTLLVNATTIKLIIEKLGLLKLSESKLQMRASVNHYLRMAGEKKVNRSKQDRYLKKANWSLVESYLPPDSDVVMGDEMEDKTIAELRKKLLAKEKSSYWHQFKEGMLSGKAIPNLTEGINYLIDQNGQQPLSDRTDLEDLWKIPNWVKGLSNSGFLNKMKHRIAVRRLAESYDAAIGFVLAQDECISLLGSIARNENVEMEILEKLEEEINANKIAGQSFIRNLRADYPTVYEALSTQRAVRTLLDYEEKTVERLQKKGRIDVGEAGHFIQDIGERRKKLESNNL